MEQDQKQQLTIRLDTGVIEELDTIIAILQKSAPRGIVLTRTDALRSTILRGIDSIRSAGKKPAAKSKVAKRG